jgi:hypothetical protein
MNLNNESKERSNKVIPTNSSNKANEPIEDLKFLRLNKWGNYEIDSKELFRFLEKNGFRSYFISDSSHIYVRIQNAIVERVYPKRMQDFLRDYIETHSTIEQETKELALSLLMESRFKFFSESQLSKLKPITLKLHRDTEKVSFLYFQNCAIRITSDSIEKIEYAELKDFHLWKNSILKRDFQGFDDNFKDFDTYQFLYRINGQDKDRTESYLSMLGYLLSNHKKQSNVKVIILNDAKYSKIPNGGTGKSLTVKMIDQFRAVTFENGKAVNLNTRFLFQKVTENTDVYHLSDVMPNFDFKRLFSIITEDWGVEKKFKDAHNIPFALSPKIVITTNTRIELKGDSAKRRSTEYFLDKYYTADFTPMSEFKEEFFTWEDPKKWELFNSMMIACLQLFLKKGLIVNENPNSKKEELISKTNADFAMYIESIFPDGQGSVANVTKAQLYENFVSACPASVISELDFRRYLNEYCFIYDKQISEKVMKVNKKATRVISIL